MSQPLPNVTLPRRPRLLPGLGVFERRSDELQIGLDPRHAVVAPNLPPLLMDILRGLDGRHTTAALLSLARDEHAERLRDLLTGLAERGLIEEAEAGDGAPESDQEPELWSAGLGRRRRDTAARRARSAVLVQGGGRLAAGVATLLAAAGVGHIDAQAQGAVTPDDLGSGLLDGDVGSSRRQALSGAIRRANSATRTTRLRGSHQPDVVVVTDAVVPAPELVSRLVAEGLAHLPVRVRDGIGIVGPLVVPGRSSCLRCADLHRTALDSCWPRVASQLAGRYQRAELNAVYGTAALAAGQVLRFLCPEETPPPAWNATLELDCYAGTVRRREWLPHAHCPCGAPRPSTTT